MLQLNLKTMKKEQYTDTIVMQNNGYFQLRANPGLWSIGIKEGRSKELYSGGGGKLIL